MREVLFDWFNLIVMPVFLFGFYSFHLGLIYVLGMIGFMLARIGNILREMSHGRGH